MPPDAPPRAADLSVDPVLSADGDVGHVHRRELRAGVRHAQPAGREVEAVHVQPVQLEGTPLEGGRDPREGEVRGQLFGRDAVELDPPAPHEAGRDRVDPAVEADLLDHARDGPRQPDRGGGSSAGRGHRPGREGAELGGEPVPLAQVSVREGEAAVLEFDALQGPLQRRRGRRLTRCIPGGRALDRRLRRRNGGRAGRSGALPGSRSEPRERQRPVGLERRFRDEALQEDGADLEDARAEGVHLHLELLEAQGFDPVRADPGPVEGELRSDLLGIPLKRARGELEPGLGEETLRSRVQSGGDEEPARGRGPQPGEGELQGEVRALRAERPGAPDPEEVQALGGDDPQVQLGGSPLGAQIGEGQGGPAREVHRRNRLEVADPDSQVLDSNLGDLEGEIEEDRPGGRGLRGVRRCTVA